MTSLNQVDAQPAYLLHRRDYRESSLLVEIFSAEFGRLTLVAKGVRSAKSEKKGLLQPFQPLLVWWRGRSELKTLTSVESSGYLPMLKATALASGFYINELIMKLTHRLDANLVLFNQYHDCLLTLSALDRNDEQFSAKLQAALRYFELDVIQASGYGVSLSTTADDGEPILADKRYLFYPEHGAVISGSENIVSDNVMQVSGHCLLALQQRSLLCDDTVLEKNLLKQAKKLNQVLLNRLLGGQILHSRSLLNQNSHNE